MPLPSVMGAALVMAVPCAVLRRLLACRSPAAEAPGVDAPMYQPGTVDVDRPDNAASLDRSARRRTQDDYSRGASTLRDGGTPGTVGPPRSASEGRHPAQGAASGSFRPLTGKAALQESSSTSSSKADVPRPEEADPQQHGPGPVDDPRDPHLRGVPRAGRSGAPDRLRLRLASTASRLRRLPQRRDARRRLAAALVRRFRRPPSTSTRARSGPT